MQTNMCDMIKETTYIEQLLLKIVAPFVIYVLIHTLLRTEISISVQLDIFSLTPTDKIQMTMIAYFPLPRIYCIKVVNVLYVPIYLYGPRNFGNLCITVI
jgi:hypothetical protein